MSLMHGDKMGSNDTDATKERQPLRTLVEDGDLVLLVGGVQPIRVSTVILKQISPVFKAMLSGRFSEGRKVGQLGLPEVDLPDDDPEIMGILCDKVHWIQQELCSDDIRDDSLIFAVYQLADKYQCVFCVKALVSEHLRVVSMSTDQAILMNRLVMAYAVDNASLFRTLSCALALCMDPLYISTLTQRSGSMALPNVAYDHLSKLHRKMDHEVRTLIHFDVALCFRASSRQVGALKVPEDINDTFEDYPQTIHERLTDILRPRCSICALITDARRHLRIIWKAMEDEVCTLEVATREALKNISREVSKMTYGLCHECIKNYPEVEPCFELDHPMHLFKDLLVNDFDDYTEDDFEDEYSF